MAQAYLDVIIEPDGSVSIEGQNFKDASCQKAMDIYLKELGVVQSVEKKKEFYGRNVNTHQNHISERS